MEREDRELIDHLAEKLKSHELPYEEGAWEQFMQYEQGRQFPARTKRILAPWLVAAASVVILILGGIYYFQKQSAQDSISNDVVTTALAPTNSEKNNPEQPHITKNSGDQIRAKSADDAAQSAYQDQNDLSNNQQLHPVDMAMATAGNPAMEATDRHNFNRIQAKDQRIVRVAGGPVHKNTGISGQWYNLLSGISQLLPKAEMNLNNSQPQSASSTEVARNNSVPAVQQDMAQNNKPAETNQGLKTGPTPSFDSNGYFDPDAPENAGDKWALGVMVIPAMGNDSRLNLGYGVSVGYRLSNRLSVNSGVSYNELSGTKNENNPSTIAAASGGKLLSSIDANVSGLNVPLELRYHVSKKIYVGAGVSALAVLSNKFERNYAVSEMQTSAFEAKNGHQLKPDEMKSIAANLTTTEDIPQAQIDSKNFAGFMNFTFGFQQKLNKKKSLSIEPYLSVPMNNNLSNQHIRLTDGGIRIKLGL